MKKSRFSETRVVKILKESEAGVAVDELSRRHGFSKSTFYKWKAKYGGLDVSQLKRLKELEEENRKLKEMYADLSLEHKFLKDVVEKYPNDRCAAAVGELWVGEIQAECPPSLPSPELASLSVPLSA